jgi:hypothetical protein
MNGFYVDDPMGDVRAEAAAVTLKHTMRAFEERYFSGSPKVKDLEVALVEGPAMLTTELVIRLNPSVASWPKLSKLLILHELIHNFLLHRDQDADDEEGSRFQAEVSRLWKAGAYVGLL